MLRLPRYQSPLYKPYGSRHTPRVARIQGTHQSEDTMAQVQNPPMLSLAEQLALIERVNKAEAVCQRLAAIYEMEQVRLDDTVPTGRTWITIPHDLGQCARAVVAARNASTRTEGC